MRAVWSGSISFVLINIPVKLFAATEDRKVHFRNLCGTCNTPINLKRWCPVCGKEVLYDNMNKGFPIEKDRFVVFTRKELDVLEPETSGIITVDKFVDTVEIIPIAFDSFYFIAPEKGAEKAYALIQKVLTLHNKAMAARLVMHGKEHVCVIAGYQKGLMLTTLHYSQEIHEINEVLDELPAPTDDEVRLASALVEKLSGKFELGEYEDNYRSMVEKMVMQKEKGEEIIVEAKAKPAAPKDLMQELRRSIEVVSQ
ncbi:MAG: Ku protein [Candidatus Methanoperedens sp.]